MLLKSALSHSFPSIGFSQASPCKAKSEMLSKLPETPDNGEIHGFENAEEISHVIDLYSSQLWDINQKVRAQTDAVECSCLDASITTL
jgi:hypothetical protein